MRATVKILRNKVVFVGVFMLSATLATGTGCGLLGKLDNGIQPPSGTTGDGSPGGVDMGGTGSPGTGGNTPPPSLTADSAVADQVISTEIGAAVASLAEDSAGGGVSGALATGGDGFAETSSPLGGPDGGMPGPGPGKAPQPMFKCTADPATGDVTITRTFGGDMMEMSKTRKGDTITETSHDQLTETIIWKKAPAGAALKCQGDGRAQISWLKTGDVDGLEQDVSSQGQSSTSTTRGTTVLSSRSTMESGQHTVKWGTPTVDLVKKTITLSKSIQLSQSWSVMTMDQKGHDVSISSMVATDPMNALMEVTVRDEGTQDWVQKTLMQGVIDSTHSDGSKIVTSYSNLVFLHARERPCLPVSGTITGQIFAKGATMPTKTFTIQFGQSTDSTVSISFGDASGQNPSPPQDFPHYRPDGCGL